MLGLPPNAFVEARDGGQFIVGTRISVDSVAHGVLRGQSVDEIHADFPALESRDKLEQVVAFVRAHPIEIQAYLAAKDQLWEEGRKLNPPHLVEKMRRRCEELKSA